RSVIGLDDLESPTIAVAAAHDGRIADGDPRVARRYALWTLCWSRDYGCSNRSGMKHRRYCANATTAAFRYRCPGRTTTIPEQSCPTRSMPLSTRSTMRRAPRL